MRYEKNAVYYKQVHIQNRLEVDEMKNNTLRVILTVVGAVVTLGAMVLAIVHFWDDIKSLLPAKKDEDFDEDFEDIAI